jgi:glycosyltransferase involved in cell wall biosynthesis
MPSWSFRYLPRLTTLLRRVRPDAILLIYLDTIYDHHPMVTFAPTIARRVLPGVPLVTQFENLLMLENPSLVTRAIRKVIRQWVTGPGTDFHYGTLLRDSRRVIVLSERHGAGLLALDQTLQERCVLIPPAPIMQMCPLGRDEERRQTRAALGLTPEDVAFCYYGYIYPGKGVETLLRAFATASQSFAQAKLLVIGSFAQHTFDVDFAARSRSYEATVHDLAASLDLDSRIRWLGHCPPTEPEGGRYLRAADACVMPFDRGVCLNNSSFSAVVSHGLATLTTVGSETEEAITRDGHVLGCPPKDPAAMAQAMTRMIAEPDLRKRLSSGADALTRAWFDWDTVVERIQATFVAA